MGGKGLLHNVDLDKGCYVNPVPFGCLNCPLERCLLDDPLLRIKEKRRQRDRAIAEVMEQEGLSVLDAVRRFGVSERTVQRIKVRVGAASA